MEDAQVVAWHNEARGQALVKNLEKRGFVATYAATADAGKQAVIERIPQGASVVFTGSQTLEQIGVKPYLRDSGKYKLLDPYEPGLSREESLVRRRQGMTADVLLSSTNALTLDGILVNVDGTGNRVAGMIFGPTKVVLAVGMNKVVTDVHEAYRKMRQYARPMNNKRLELPNPCTKTGVCEDCKNSTRICNYFTRIERSFVPGRFHIVLIGADLGY